MRRREFITLVGGAAAAWPVAARAQQTTKVPQVGFLYPGSTTSAAPRIAAVTSGLQAGGIRVPDQATIIPSATDGDSARLAPMAADLIARKAVVIVVVGPEALRAASAASTTIPIVALDLESDPIDSGFVASYARPGGNITGVFLDFPDFSKKLLEALKEAVPKISSVGILWDPSSGMTQRRAIDAAARTLDLKLVVLEMRGRRVGIRNGLQTGPGSFGDPVVALRQCQHQIARRSGIVASPPGHNPVSALRPRWRPHGIWAQSSQLLPPRRHPGC